MSQPKYLSSPDCLSQHSQARAARLLEHWSENSLHFIKTLAKLISDGICFESVSIDTAMAFVLVTPTNKHFTKMHTNYWN